MIAPAWHDGDMDLGTHLSWTPTRVGLRKDMGRRNLSSFRVAHEDDEAYLELHLSNEEWDPLKEDDEILTCCLVALLRENILEY
ncbi:hypothetical protein OIU84_002178 [Salix udensis]|uniref:Uncharacterized protein n=1 Tax=Salix udensis TaxID=889485 RepID=A0AAD6K550_9ROSI|nr:hypothetical protein OIU84_002178 [Salix udensis]